jgi:hypothetical protein
MITGAIYLVYFQKEIAIMRIPILFSLFLIFLIIFNIKLKKSTRQKAIQTQSFFQKERESMFVRKKSLDSLHYITLDLATLPLRELDPDSTPLYKKAYAKQESVVSKASLPMVHMEESNIDLKLTFGPANLEIIIQYEENYTQFMRALLQWALALQEAALYEECIQVLEISTALRSDFSKTYILLRDLYIATHQKHKLPDLLTLAQSIPSLTMAKAVRHIEYLLNHKGE